ncbi:TetR/AcrR family transcriptional regulator [Fibrella sp. WM1]|uniref:TetR/AcrR family transcriptional regulator n=1 Tax=Fibrella musci TaxID=3242485 RepID=UPI003520E864
MAQEPKDTEVKIKEAARRVFLEKGYEGAKIRQIADAAGVNVALVNYYFRSKEELFRSIYQETLADFLSRLAILLNEETPIEVKIWKLVDRYVDFLMDNPMIPSFILSQANAEAGGFVRQLPIKEIVEQSYFRKQLLEEAAKGTIRPVHPLQLIMSMIANIVFPVIARPVLSYIGSLDDEAYRQFINDRKKIVPEMLMAYLQKK